MNMFESDKVFVNDLMALIEKNSILILFIIACSAFIGYSVNAQQTKEVLHNPLIKYRFNFLHNYIFKDDEVNEIFKSKFFEKENLKNLLTSEKFRSSGINIANFAASIDFGQKQDLFFIELKNKNRDFADAVFEYLKFVSNETNKSISHLENTFTNSSFEDLAILNKKVQVLLQNYYSDITPYVIFEPPTKTIYKSPKNKIFILVLSSFMGIIVSFLVIIFLEFFKKLRST